MIPNIKLDDRSFDDIREEAIRLIPRYCPQWTNRNISDPGMTLLSLFSWMTEMTLHRVNKIPTKTYIALLDLLGFSFKPPKGAKTILKFFINPNREREVLVKKGTKVGSVDASSEPVVFETQENLLVRNIKLEKCINRDKDNWTDVPIEEGEVEAFSLFDSQNAVTHELYLATSDFRYLIDGHMIQLRFETVREVVSMKDELINYVNWEYYNGEEWMAINPSPSFPGYKNTTNTLFFLGPVEDMSPCMINGKERLALRATLVDLPDMSSAAQMDPFNIRAIKYKVIYMSDGFAPDSVMTYSRGSYMAVNIDNSFRIFSEQPAFDEACYICADSIFKNKGIKVFITYKLSELNSDIKPNNLAQFVYEYYDGNKWIRFTKEKNEFEDTTQGFTKSGRVGFKVPETFSMFKLQGSSGYWIRVRIVSENLGKGGKFALDEKTKEWKWNFDDQVQSPYFDRMRIGYDLYDQYMDSIVTYSNFKWNELTYFCEEHESSMEMKVFDIDREHLPALYLGFDKPISLGSFPIYFKIDEITKNVGTGNVFDAAFGSDEENPNFVAIEWQTWNGIEWKTLSSTDSTNCFQESGYISFSSEGDMQKSSLFDYDAYWVRGIKMNGNFERIPTVKSIVLNSVFVSNEDSYKDEFLSGPGPSYSPQHSPLLPGTDIVVMENGIPTKSEIAAMAKDGIKEPYFMDGNKVWVRYKEVPNFYNSNAFSRHFVIDYQGNKIIFGDGVHGLSPSKNKYTIKILNYKVGGGKTGNVSSHKLQYLASSIPFIDGCDNPFGAEGGSDMESLDGLRARASGLLKSLERAVTPEDYEWLSKEASPAVGRSYCLRDINKFGEAKLIIVPVSDRAAGYKLKLYPSRELIKQVRSYLNQRKVIGTSVVVTGPTYRSFDLKIDVVFKSNYFDYEAEEAKVEEVLREYFHPLYGGDGAGWQHDNNISVGLISKKLETVESIQKVMRLEMYDCDRSLVVDEIMLEEDEMPYLSGVKIAEKQY